jgi:hypothetical protein
MVLPGFIYPDFRLKARVRETNGGDRIGRVNNGEEADIG